MTSRVLGNGSSLQAQMKRLAVATTICALVWVSPADSLGSQDLPHPRRQDLAPSERLAALVDLVRLQQQAATTLKAGFTQIRESSMLVEPVESKGMFYFAAPDRVRWEYLSPDPISMLIRGDEMTTWFRDIDQAERVQVGRHSQRILKYLGAGSSMEDMLEYFSVSLTVPEDETLRYRLLLTTEFDKVAKRLQEMTIWIDPELYLPLRLRYVEADGDVTDMKFDDLSVNGEIPESRFNLDIPSSVQVRQVDLDHSTSLP